MALFPSVGPEYYNETDREILQYMETFYAESISLHQAYWSEGDTDSRFHAGDQSVWSDIYGGLPVNRRKQFNFNRIRRVVDMISGHQRRNRMSTVIVPVENGDELTADQFTKVMMWINQQENVLDTISESFNGSLITGMNLLQVWVDYRTDPISGNIKVDNCPYNSFLIDPFFKKADLSDCNAIWKRSFLTKRECMSLLPDKEEMILSLHGQSSRDNKFQFMPENYNYGMKNLLTYDEFYYRDYRTCKLLVDTQTGETHEWSGKDDNDLNEFLRRYPTVTVTKSEIPTVRLAIVVQGKVVYHDRNPSGSDLFPFVPVLSYYQPEIPYFPLRIQGVVRGLRDAQYLYNRRKIIEMDILESQVNSGWKFKEDALVDPKSIHMSGQGRGLALKQQAQMTDVEQIMPPQIPPSMFQLSEGLAKEIQEISGINEELLGSAIDDKAGILAMLRQGAGLTTLQGLFDRLDRSQRLLGKVIIDIIQNNFTPGKIKRIIAEEPSPQFYNKQFGKYDAAVEEGLNTTTQRQMALVQLLKLKELGIAIPDAFLLKHITVQDKTELIKSIEDAQKAQQEQAQQAQQIQMQEIQSRTELAHARAQADQGLYVERVSRVAENQSMAVERNAQAETDRTQATLNMIKSVKELEDIDIAHLERLLNIARSVKESESNAADISQKEAIKPQPTGPQ